MTAQSLIEEVKNSLSKYADAGLIDEDSLYRNIVLGLKRFGNDVMVLQESVVHVKDGEAKLSQGFWSLYLAYLCEPLGYKRNNIEVHDLQSSFFYRERVEKTNTWSECDACCDNVTEKIVRENLYFNNSKVEFMYHRPRLLSLGKTFKKNACHAQCRNKFVKDNPNEITIDGTTLGANFDSGYIYMQFYGLPQDDEGVIEIPESKNGHLETYLEYHLKRRLAEDLIANNDAQGLSNMYSIYAQQEQIALKNASAELKMTKIGRKGTKRISRLNKLESLQYETNFPC